MNLLRCAFFFLSTTTLALGQAASHGKTISLPNDPNSFVQSFYQQVVAHHPTGIPYGENMKILAPYLSKSLLHKIDLARACGGDWYRRHPGHSLKPPLAWLESGLFSGDDERTDPNVFAIESTESEKDGSFRVYVRLTGGEPPDTPWTWRVAAVLVREKDKLVLDDVIYLKDQKVNTDWRLSEVLADGCKGTRWVGDSDKKDDATRKK